jgi:hypothetical protein
MNWLTKLLISSSAALAVVLGGLAAPTLASTPTDPNCLGVGTLGRATTAPHFIPFGKKVITQFTPNGVDEFTLNQLHSLCGINP